MTTDQINEPAEAGDASQPVEANTESVAEEAITITSADIVGEFGAELAGEAEAEAPPTEAVNEAEAAAAADDEPTSAADQPPAEAAAETTAPAEAAPAAPDDPTAEAEADEAPPGRRKQRMRPASNKEIRRVQEAFAACVRCGYFLSDYRMLFGEEHFAEMVGRSRGDWLDLNWSEELRIIVEKSFGIRMDSDLDYYQGCCDMCRRTFAYSAGEDIEATMRVQVRMESAQPRQSRRRRR